MHDAHHASLIDMVHHGIRLHPDPAFKASYGGILAKLLADQAKMHAAQPRAGGAPSHQTGGGQPVGDTPYGHYGAGDDYAATGPSPFGPHPSGYELVNAPAPPSLAALVAARAGAGDVTRGFVHNPVPTPFSYATRLAQILGGSAGA